MKKLFAMFLALVMTVAMAVSMTGCKEKEFVGFDIDLAKAVAEKLELKVDFVEINWSMKEAELDNKSIDVVWNGFTYTQARDDGYYDEDRKQQIGGLDFSGMYMKNKQVAVVKKDKVADYDTLDEIKAASTFVAEDGSAGIDVISNVFEKTPVAVEKQLDIFNEISSGTSDVGVLDAVMAGYYITAETGVYHDSLAVVEFEGAEEEFYAIGFREGSNLTAVFNNVLAGLWADGTILEIATEYGLQDVIVNDFGEYDADFVYPTDGDYKLIKDKGEFVLGYTLFAPMAYNV